jgi:acyl-CoA thioester hydrolase
MVVAAAGMRFLAPARFDDDLELVIDIARIGVTSTTTRVTVERAGASLAEIEIRHVVVDLESRAKRPIPAPMREALQPFMMSG